MHWVSHGRQWHAVYYSDPNHKTTGIFSVSTQIRQKNTKRLPVREVFSHSSESCQWSSWGRKRKAPEAQSAFSSWRAWTRWHWKTRACQQNRMLSVSKQMFGILEARHRSDCEAPCLPRSCPSFPLEMHSSPTVGNTRQSPCLHGGCTWALCLSGLLWALPTADTTWQSSHGAETWKMASPTFAAFPFSANDHCPNIFPRLFKCFRKSHRFSPDMALTNYKAWNKVKKFNSFTANCHEQTPDQIHFSSSCIKNTIDVLITL